MLLKSFFFLEKISTMTQLDSSNWMLIPIRTTSFSVSYSLIAIFIWRGCHATCAHFSFSPTKKMFALMNTYGYPLINSSFRHFCCQVARMKNATIGDTQCISPLPFFFYRCVFSRSVSFHCAGGTNLTININTRCFLFDFFLRDMQHSFKDYLNEFRRW